MDIKQAPNEWLETFGKGYTDQVRQLDIGQYFTAGISTRLRWAQLAKSIGYKVKTKKISDDEIAVIRIG